jgi:hypothetical protein
MKKPTATAQTQAPPTLPDLDHSKTSVLSTLRTPDSQRTAEAVSLSGERRPSLIE